MNWLHRADAMSIFQRIRDPIQRIVVEADIDTLLSVIPVSPYLQESDIQPPLPTLQWYCINESQDYLIECPIENDRPSPEIHIYTPFHSINNSECDWKVLCHMTCFPKSIQIKRPLYVESSRVNHEFCVIRPDKRGWSHTVYCSLTLCEANAFLQFILEDPYNRECVVSRVESPGKWKIEVRSVSESLTVGYYTERNVSLECAWKYANAMNFNKDVFVIDESTGESHDAYFITIEGAVALK